MSLRGLKFLPRSGPLVVMVVACSCGLSAPPFEAELSTADLELESVGDAPILRQQASLLQEQLRWLKEVFGDDDYEAPTWVRVFPDEDPPACDEGALIRGCHGDALLQTTWDAAPHLLVHAFLEAGGAAPHPALAEGVATWGSGIVQASPLSDRREIAGHLALSGGELHDPEVQASLGHFIAWIEARHGAAAVADVVRGAGAEMGAEELHQHIGATLDAGFDALLDDYAATSRDYYPGRGPYACGSGSESGSGSVGVSLGVDWGATLNADGGGTLNRYISDTEVEFWRRQSYTFEQGGSFDVQLSSGGVITRCLEAPTDEAELPQVEPPIQADWRAQRPHPRPAGIPDDFAEPVVLDLEAALYDVWLGRSAQSEAEIAEGSVQSVDIGG